MNWGRGEFMKKSNLLNQGWKTDGKYIFPGNYRFQWTICQFLNHGIRFSSAAIYTLLKEGHAITKSKISSTKTTKVWSFWPQIYDYFLQWNVIQKAQFCFAIFFHDWKLEKPVKTSLSFSTHCEEKTFFYTIIIVFVFVSWLSYAISIFNSFDLAIIDDIFSRVSDRKKHYITISLRWKFDDINLVSTGSKDQRFQSVPFY